MACNCITTPPSNPCLVEATVCSGWHVIIPIESTATVTSNPSNGQIIFGDGIAVYQHNGVNLLPDTFVLNVAGGSCSTLTVEVTVIEGEPDTHNIIELSANGNCAVGEETYLWTLPTNTYLATGYTGYEQTIQVYVPVFNPFEPNLEYEFKVNVCCGNCNDCCRCDIITWTPPICIEECGEEIDCFCYDPCKEYNPVTGSCEPICDAPLKCCPIVGEEREEINYTVDIDRTCTITPGEGLNISLEVVFDVSTNLEDVEFFIPMLECPSIGEEIFQGDCLDLTAFINAECGEFVEENTTGSWAHTMTFSWHQTGEGQYQIKFEASIDTRIEYIHWFNQYVFVIKGETQCEERVYYPHWVGFLPEIQSELNEDNIPIYCDSLVNITNISQLADGNPDFPICFPTASCESVRPVNTIQCLECCNDVDCPTSNCVAGTCYCPDGVTLPDPVTGLCPCPIGLPPCYDCVPGLPNYILINNEPNPPCGLNEVQALNSNGDCICVCSPTNCFNPVTQTCEPCPECPTGQFLQQWNGFQYVSYSPLDCNRCHACITGDCVQQVCPPGRVFNPAAVTDSSQDCCIVDPCSDNQCANNICVNQPGCFCNDNIQCVSCDTITCQTDVDCPFGCMCGDEGVCIDNPCATNSCIGDECAEVEGCGCTDDNGCYPCSHYTCEDNSDCPFGCDCNQNSGLCINSPCNIVSCQGDTCAETEGCGCDEDEECVLCNSVTCTENNDCPEGCSCLDNFCQDNPCYTAECDDNYNCQQQDGCGCVEYGCVPCESVSCETTEDCPEGCNCVENNCNYDPCNFFSQNCVVNIIPVEGAFEVLMTRNVVGNIVTITPTSLLFSDGFMQPLGSNLTWEINVSNFVGGFIPISLLSGITANANGTLTINTSIFTYSYYQIKCAINSTPVFSVYRYDALDPDNVFLRVESTPCVSLVTYEANGIQVTGATSWTFNNVEIPAGSNTLPSDVYFAGDTYLMYNCQSEPVDIEAIVYNDLCTEITACASTINCVCDGAALCENPSMDANMTLNGDTWELTLDIFDGDGVRRPWMCETLSALQFCGGTLNSYNCSCGGLNPTQVGSMPSGNISCIVDNLTTLPCNNPTDNDIYRPDSHCCCGWQYNGVVVEELEGAYIKATITDYANAFLCFQTELQGNVDGNCCVMQCFTPPQPENCELSGNIAVTCTEHSGTNFDNFNPGDTNIVVNITTNYTGTPTYTLTFDTETGPVEINNYVSGTPLTGYSILPNSEFTVNVLEEQTGCTVELDSTSCCVWGVLPIFETTDCCLECPEDVDCPEGWCVNYPVGVTVVPYPITGSYGAIDVELSSVSNAFPTTSYVGLNIGEALGLYIDGSYVVKDFPGGTITIAESVPAPPVDPCAVFTTPIDVNDMVVTVRPSSLYTIDDSCEYYSNNQDYECSFDVPPTVDMVCEDVNTYTLEINYGYSVHTLTTINGCVGGTITVSHTGDIVISECESDGTDLTVTSIVGSYNCEVQTIIPKEDFPVCLEEGDYLVKLGGICDPPTLIFDINKAYLNYPIKIYTDEFNPVIVANNLTQLQQLAISGSGIAVDNNDPDKLLIFIDKYLFEPFLSNFSVFAQIGCNDPSCIVEFEYDVQDYCVGLCATKDVQYTCDDGFEFTNIIPGTDDATAEFISYLSIDLNGTCSQATPYLVEEGDVIADCTNIFSQTVYGVPGMVVLNDADCPTQYKAIDSRKVVIDNISFDCLSNELTFDIVSAPYNTYLSCPECYVDNTYTNTLADNPVLIPAKSSWLGAPLTQTMFIYLDGSSMPSSLNLTFESNELIGDYVYQYQGIDLYVKGNGCSYVEELDISDCITPCNNQPDLAITCQDCGRNIYTVIDNGGNEIIPFTNLNGIYVIQIDGVNYNLPGLPIISVDENDNDFMTLKDDILQATGWVIVAKEETGFNYLYILSPCCDNESVLNAVGVGTTGNVPIPNTIELVSSNTICNNIEMVLGSRENCCLCYKAERTGYIENTIDTDIIYVTGDSTLPIIDWSIYNEPDCIPVDKTTNELYFYREVTYTDNCRPSLVIPVLAEAETRDAYCNNSRSYFFGAIENISQYTVPINTEFDVVVTGIGAMPVRTTTGNAVWVGTNKIKLTQDLLPGQVFTFGISHNTISCPGQTVTVELTNNSVSPNTITISKTT